MSGGLSGGGLPPQTTSSSLSGIWGIGPPPPDSPAQDVRHDMLCTFSLLSKSFNIFLFNSEGQPRLGGVWGRERPAQQDDSKDRSLARV